MRGSEFLIASVILVACEDRPSRSFEQPEDHLRAPAREIDTVDARLDGQTLRLEGGVEAVLTDRAFILEQDQPFDDAQITVVTRGLATVRGLPLQDRHRVVVVGIVRTDLAAVERELGRELPVEVAKSIGKRPVIVARDIYPVDDTL